MRHSPYFYRQQTKPNPEVPKHGNKKQLRVHTGLLEVHSKVQNVPPSPKALGVVCNMSQTAHVLSLIMHAYFACFATVEPYLLAIIIKLISTRASRCSRKLCHVLL